MNNWVKEELDFLKKEFRFLLTEFGFALLEEQIVGYSYRAIYCSTQFALKFDLFVDIQEKALYFRMIRTNGQCTGQQDDVTHADFYEVFRSINPSISWDDVQPLYNEATSRKVRRNAELLRKFLPQILKQEL